MGYTAKISKSAKVYIAEEGFDRKNGVRPLKRAIQRLFEDPISELIIDSKIVKGETINVSVSKDKKQIDNTDENDFFSAFTFKKPIYFSLPILIISIALTLFGVDLAVNSAVFISKELNIPDSFIGLSLIAIGTSLPELVTSISAAKRGNNQIIFGNKSLAVFLNFIKYFLRRKKFYP